MLEISNFTRGYSFPSVQVITSLVSEVDLTKNEAGQFSDYIDLCLRKFKDISPSLNGHLLDIELCRIQMAWRRDEVIQMVHYVPDYVKDNLVYS